MEKIITLLITLLFTIISLTGCSSDDTVLPVQEEYLTARINGENFNVGSQNGLMLAEKQLTPFGSINLFAKINTVDGKTIEFKVFNYVGKNRYPIGKRQFPEFSNPINGNWCNYSEVNPSGHWSTVNDLFSSGDSPNYVEITADDGAYIAGNLSFEGFEVSGASSKRISEGKFWLKMDH